MAHYYPPRALKRINPPSLEPITLAEAKLFLRVDGSTEDSVITSLMAVAREAAEQCIMRSLITQDWQITYHQYAPLCITLPMQPIQSVLSVVSVDEAGVQVTISSTHYAFDASAGVLEFDSEISGTQVRINYRAGYGDAANDVPHPIRHAILTHIAALFDDRSAEAIPLSSRSLLQPYREVRL